jgi:uncharacterized protein (UPF0262 family)
MKQINLFGQEFQENSENKYTNKIQTPLYEPKNKKPYSLELVDDVKTKRLIAEIQNSNIAEEDKKFLILSAYRHLVFNYTKIADYYAHSSKEVQELMEKSALVIIDFEKAIEYGYVQLSEEISKLYLEDYSNNTNNEQ